MMFFLDVLIFFVLPILILILTRKRPVYQMVLWTAIVQAVAVAARIVMYPVAWCLSWGFSFSKAISFENLAAWYSGSGIQMLFLALASIVFTVLIVFCAVAIRKKKGVPQ